MPYLNVAEVESALQDTANTHPTVVQRILLPNASWEGRQISAVKVGRGSNPGRPGVFFLGGLHAREWGSSDILVNFVRQLAQAYAANAPLTFGSRTFTAAQIRSIVEALDIFVLPQANPDGRHYSMTVDADWRKNRRTASPSTTGNCVGVDLNRNFDFLFDFPTAFSPSAGVSCSTDPCNRYLYHGPSAFSEPETRNARWLLDTHPNIGYYIDVHSFGGLILHNWGDDETQSVDASQTFRNPAFNGVRGVGGDTAYREHIHASDRAEQVALANAINGGIQAVRGTSYTVQSAYALYPTSGTSSDYAYSRWLVDGSKRKVHAHVIEWGTEFQPPYAEMATIIQEITCGLLAYCLKVRDDLRRMSFIVDRSTFGEDEVQARLLAGSPAQFPGAFYVVVDGETPSALGITAADLSGPPTARPTLTVSPNNVAGLAIGPPSALLAADPSLPNAPQRFTWVYPVSFSNTNGFNQPVRTVTLGATMGALSAGAQLQLIEQPNPYEVDGATHWLSTDLRVFRSKRGQGRFGATVGGNAPADAVAFIRDVIGRLNAGNTAGQTFDGLDPNATEIALNAADTAGNSIFNFAVARVRYRGIAQGARAVRVFFRLCPALSVSLAFDPATTYRSHLAPAPTPSDPPRRVPLLGLQGGNILTIPCFATARVTPGQPMTAQEDTPNVQDFAAEPSGNEVVRYFGCWLDINQQAQAHFPLNPGGDGPYSGALRSVFELVRYQHQCLVAEIAFDPATIPPAATPGTSDKIAQRNLTMVTSANPGDVASRRIPNAFEFKPTQPGRARPDELMFEWGSVPAGSVARLYTPTVEADRILQMAADLGTLAGLAKVDPHTVEWTTGAVTYIPVPPGPELNHTALLTIDLPYGVRKGQRFDAVVRQVTLRAGPRPPQEETPQDGEPDAVSLARVSHVADRAPLPEWQHVLGAFQVGIPVETKDTMLRPEARLYSMLLWILRSIPPHDRWYPVFHRYVEEVGARVKALGGDPDSIRPSATGDGVGEDGEGGDGPGGKVPGGPGGPGDASGGHGEDDGRGDGLGRGPFRETRGKVKCLLFDRFGDFEGFCLETPAGVRTFRSRERAMQEVADRAWSERIPVAVLAPAADPDRPARLVLQRWPRRRC